MNIYIFLIVIVIVLLIINDMIQTAADAIKKQIAIEIDKICRKQDEQYEELIWRMPEPTKDRLLYEVAKWGIEGGSVLSTSAIQRHFSISYARAGKIVDQLHGMGVCSGSNGGTDARVLIDMGELMRLERSGVFK